MDDSHSIIRDKTHLRFYRTVKADRITVAIITILLLIGRRDPARPNTQQISVQQPLCIAEVLERDSVESHLIPQQITELPSEAWYSACYKKIANGSPEILGLDRLICLIDYDHFDLCGCLRVFDLVPALTPPSTTTFSSSQHQQPFYVPPSTTHRGDQPTWRRCRGRSKQRKKRISHKEESLSYWWGGKVVDEIVTNTVNDLPADSLEELEELSTDLSPNRNSDREWRESSGRSASIGG